MTEDVTPQLRCARCDIPLHHAQNGGFAIDGCADCGGAWLSTTAATTALAARGGTPYELALQLSRTTRPNPVFLAKEPHCPVCRGALARVDNLGVEVDVCREHGTWFDWGELLRLTKPEAATPIVHTSQAAMPGTYRFLELYQRLCVPLAALAGIAGVMPRSRRSPRTRKARAWPRA
jgi:Zn-finger nucleic acid-binding protein